MNPSARLLAMGILERSRLVQCQLFEVLTSRPGQVCGAAAFSQQTCKKWVGKSRETRGTRDMSPHLCLLNRSRLPMGGDILNWRFSMYKTLTELMLSQGLKSTMHCNYLPTWL